MSFLHLDRLLEMLQSTEFILGLLWIGLGAITITLLVMMLTRWGQYQPVRKCLTLSILAHLLLAGYSTTVKIVSPTPAREAPAIRVAINDGRLDKDAAVPQNTRPAKPWETFVEPPTVRPDAAELARAEAQDLRTPERQAPADPSDWAVDLSLDHLPLASAPEVQPKAMPSEKIKQTPGEVKDAEPIEASVAQRREAVRTKVPVLPEVERNGLADNSPSEAVRRSQAGLPSELLERPVRVPRLDSDSPRIEEPADLLAGATEPESSAPAGDMASLYASPAPPVGMPQEPKPAAASVAGPKVNLPLSSTPRPSEVGHETPEAYKLRSAPDRPQQAERQGASPETERAVALALKWLAANQEPDGRWSAVRHEAGYEMRIAGRDRQNAGSRADTAMTGLSLLTFLAAGHTHRQGDYHATVRRGLEYLIRVQRSDGGLGGNGATYEYNYCHGMAAIALSEAYGMTGDIALEAPVRRAVAYTLANQNASSGGWRYNSWDIGDTSQLGWQWMALKSAELAGIPIPEKTRAGVIRFLATVTSGPQGGLAAYRNGEAASRPMTAEALFVRQLLGLDNNSPAAKEAAKYVLEQLPGHGEDNVYYWYYGTLAMYQMQGPAWERWNGALQRRLIATQRNDGTAAGSWDPDRIWGGYGGRIYSTTLSALCLEVYYRYLPLYAQSDRPNSVMQ